MDNSAIVFMEQMGRRGSSANIKKKNAGEISLTILAEVFSWYYPETEAITVFTQERDSYVYQSNAHKILKNEFSGRASVAVSYNPMISCYTKCTEIG